MKQIHHIDSILHNHRLVKSIVRFHIRTDFVCQLGACKRITWHQTYKEKYDGNQYPDRQDGSNHSLDNIFCHIHPPAVYEIIQERSDSPAWAFLDHFLLSIFPLSGHLSGQRDFISSVFQFTFILSCLHIPSQD